MDSIASETFKHTTRIISTSTTGGGLNDECLSTRVRDYHKAAIALNNAAVSLLVRGFHRYAVDTFSDAMKCMRIVTVSSDDFSDSESSRGICCMEEVRSILDRSAKRTALSFKIGVGVVGPIETNTASPHLCAVSTQCNPTSLYEALTDCAQCVATPQAFPMTIDPIDFHESSDQDEEDFGFHSGVILYNYGIAHGAMAQIVVANDNVAANHIARRRIQAKAHRIFQLTKALLSKIDQRTDHNSTARLFEFSSSRTLLLCTFLTHSLVQSAIQMELPTEYEEYRRSMSGLWHLLSSVHRLLLPIADPTRAAAA